MRNRSMFFTAVAPSRPRRHTPKLATDVGRDIGDGPFLLVLVDRAGRTGVNGVSQRSKTYDNGVQRTRVRR